MADFAQEIAKILSQYSQDVEEGLEKAKEDVAKVAVARLKKNSPRRTGRYARGWRTKRVGTAQVIYNATDYQLTHLLEHGHAKRNGGRVAGIPHIRPVEEKAIEEFLGQVEQVVRG
jgi:hypothetical protein